MPIKEYKPTTPGVRFKKVVKRYTLWRGDPLKFLTVGKIQRAGRGNTGRITVRHRGGGNKQLFRIIDFKRDLTLEAVVKRIEYDPNRSARIALIQYADGLYSYILASKNMKSGLEIQNGKDAVAVEGNTLYLRDIPQGCLVHNIEARMFQGGKYLRAAGSFGRLISKDMEKATILFKSGVTKQFPLLCRATIGIVSNPEHYLRVLGKAGISRHLGLRPKVRGVAMNPIDHPHGGDTSGGRPSVTPWGRLTKGKPTTKKKKEKL